MREAAVMAGGVRQQQAVDATTGQVLFELAQLRSAVSQGVPIGNLHPALENQKNTMDVLRRQVASLASAPTAVVAIQHNKITALQTRIELLDVAGLAWACSPGWPASPSSPRASPGGSA